MNYLDQATLKVFIYFLYSDNKVSLINLMGKTAIIVAQICDSNLDECFYIDTNDQEIKKIEEFYNGYKYNPESCGYPYQQAISSHKKQSIIELKNFIEPIEDFFYKALFTGHLYNLNFRGSKRKQLVGFSNRYIEEFKKNQLISENNFYPYKKNIGKTLEIIKKYYDKFGTAFNLSGYKEKDKIEANIEKELRFYESILCLAHQGYLSINNCRFFTELDKSYLLMKINLNYSPDEIKKKEDTTLSYGDLTLDANTGLAIYKSNQYRFKTTSRTFKLLAKLIKNPEKILAIKPLYKEIAKGSSESSGSEKEKINNYIKNIKKKLKISTDKERTIGIGFIEYDNIKLTKKI